MIIHHDILCLFHTSYTVISTVCKQIYNLSSYQDEFSPLHWLKKLKWTSQYLRVFALLYSWRVILQCSYIYHTISLLSTYLCFTLRIRDMRGDDVRGDDVRGYDVRYSPKGLYRNSYEPVRGTTRLFLSLRSLSSLSVVHRLTACIRQLPSPVVGTFLSPSIWGVWKGKVSTSFIDNIYLKILDCIL